MSPKTLRVLVVPDNDRLRAEVKEIAPGLDSMQAAVGGYIEAISGSGWTAYCDEEGKIKDLSVNIKATRLARIMGWPKGDVLFGPVVFLGAPDSEGDDTSVGDTVLGSAALLGY